MAAETDPFNAHDTPPRTAPLSDAALIALFAAFVGLPLVGVFRSDVDAELARFERRQAAPFPQLEFRPGRWFPRKQSIQDFPRGFQAWFNDHVGFRRQFIQAWNLARLSGLATEAASGPRAGQSGQCPVIVGRNGWLFYSSKDVVDDYRCTRPFTAAELDEWRSALTARRHWLEARGIRYIVMVAPNKHTIYPEFLPRSVNRVGKRSRLDQLIEHLSGPDGVQIVDVRDTLREGKRHRPTYHQTDTHWNDYGAWLAYGRLLTSLQPSFPQLLPCGLDEFQIVHRERERNDLAAMLDSPLAERERSIQLVPTRPRRAFLPEFGIIAEATPARTSDCPDAELESAVVLHDSFVVALAPFLSEHFERVEYVWTTDFPAYVIDRERPQIVIHEFVERELMKRPPEAPPDLSPPPRLAGAQGGSRTGL